MQTNLEYSIKVNNKQIDYRAGYGTRLTNF